MDRILYLEGLRGRTRVENSPRLSDCLSPSFPKTGEGSGPDDTTGHNDRDGSSGLSTDRNEVEEFKGIPVVKVTLPSLWTKRGSVR